MWRAMIPSVRLRLWMMLAVCGTVLFASSVFAQVPPAQAQPTPSNCSAYVGLTNHIAGCILDSVDKAARVFYTQFYPSVANFVLAITLLGVIFYGIMIVAGMVDDVGKSTVLLFLKIGAVSFFVQNPLYMYDTIYTAMNDTAAEVVGLVPTAGPVSGNTTANQITCLANMTGASIVSGRPVSGPWLAIDCMIDSVIGIKVPNANGQTNADAAATNKKISLERSGVSRGLLYFFSSSLTTSVVGMIIGAIGFLFLWSLLALTIKTLLTYISGFLGITFLIIISPLFIPLVLLPGATPRQYFSKWVELVIGFALQPILMLVFIMVFIAAVDLAMFSGDYSIMYRIAGDASRQQGFDINQYLVDSEAVDSKKATKLWDVKTDRSLPELVQNQGKSLVEGLQESDCGKEALEGMALGVNGRQVKLSEEDKKACSQSSPVQTYRRSIDWEKLAAVRSPAVQMEDGATTIGQQMSREVLSASIFCAVILLVMNRIASVVPKMINDLVGGLGQTPNLYANATSIRQSQPRPVKR